MPSSKKKGKKEQAAEIEAGKKLQETVLAALGHSAPRRSGRTVPAFDKALDDGVARSRRSKCLRPSARSMLSAHLSERDETADICTDDEGCPEADPELRDTENVPLAEDVSQFFEREVKPHVPDAWVNTAIRDHKDKEVGKVGYEINFNRYFYQYQPPRPLEEIEADIRDLEKDILAMLREVAG